MNDPSSLLGQLQIDRGATTSHRATGKRPAWPLIVMLVGVAIASAWWVFSERKQAPAPPAEVTETLAPSVLVAPANAAGSMLDTSGYVVARRQATVSAKTTGRVVEVFIEEGQRVEKNQVIARLDSSNAAAALQEAQALLGQAQAGLGAAQLAEDDAYPIYLRNLKQRDAGVISAQSFDSAQAAYHAIHASREFNERSVDVAQATLATAQRNLDDTVIRSPFAGMITVKAAQPGEIVSPLSASSGFTRSGIGTIVDMESLEVEVDVSENFISRIHAGQAAVIRLNAYPDWEIPAHTIAVIPTADRAKATVKVRVGFDEKDARILPDMGARVSFTGD